MPEDRELGQKDQAVLPLDNIDEFVGDNIERGKARVANVVTVLLIFGVLIAPLLFIIAVCITPSLATEFKAFFESWFTMLGPIVGTAVGFYFGESRGQNANSGRRGRRRR